MNDKKPGQGKRRVNPMLLLGADADVDRKLSEGEPVSSKVSENVVDGSVVVSENETLEGVNSEGVNSEDVKVSSKRRGDVSDLLSVGGGSQPSLVEVGDFEPRVSPTRVNVKRKPVNGFTPFPAQRKPEGNPAGVGEGEDDVVSPIGDNEKHVFFDENTGEVFDAPGGGSEGESVEGTVKPVNPGKKSIPAPPGVNKNVGVKSGDDSKPAPRKVNPLFLAGEEKEYVDVEAAKTGKDRVLRPNFILTGERENVPSIVLPKRNLRKPFQPLPEGEAKPRGQYSRKVDSHVEAEEWTDDDSTDTSAGLGGEKDDYKGAQYSKGFHLTERDVILIRFLARYRYAYVDQLARLVDSTPRTVAARLRKLEERGFIRKELIAGRQYLWVSRKAGNALVDIAFNEIKKGSLSYVTVAHTIGLVNLGVEFEREAGGKDLLGEGKEVVDWEMPFNRWKFGIWGHPDGRVRGEMTVTEREIRQGQLRWRGGRSSKEMRELVSLAAANSEPVELEEGQEGLFVIYGQGGAGGEHIPDLVVARERDENGRPQHIAIELELTAKTFEEWRKVLRNFRDNGLASEDGANSGMYSKIVYFTHKRSIANGLRKADEEVGLGDKLVIRKYNPSGNLPFWG